MTTDLLTSRPKTAEELRAEHATIKRQSDQDLKALESGRRSGKRLLVRDVLAGLFIRKRSA